MNNMTDTAIPEVSAVLRRCALTLHAIGSQDRQWLLARLPLDRRTELEELVNELRALGIPADPRVAQAALDHDHREAPAFQATEPRGRGGSALDIVTSAPATELALLLQHEPPTLIAHVVALREAGGDALLSQLSTARRRQVQEVLLRSAARSNSAALAPQLAQALLDQIAAGLALRPQRRAESARTRPRPWLPQWPHWGRVRS